MKGATKVEEKKSKGAFTGWWIVNKKGDVYELTRRTKDGSLQVISSGSLRDAIEIASCLGGENV